MDSILTASGLNVGYKQKTVISDIHLNALKGQVICLLGPNGAGKTTILRTLSGLLAPVSGRVQIIGQDLSQLSKKELSRKLSIVLTDAVSPSLTTVCQLLALGRTPYTGFFGRLSEEDRNIIEESLETVGAAGLKERYYCELSDGEKQKVLIARALVQEPELIILDEPTSHLDIRHKIEVIRVLQKLSHEKGITCILSLHDIDLALKGCERVLLVEDGKIAAQGIPEDVAGQGMIQKLYRIQGAKYNENSGSIELCGREGNDIFIAGGCSTGTSLYRALSRRGYALTSGVLHRNDGDYPVAESICSAVVSEDPFEMISERAFAAAEQLMSAADFVIDSGFPVGTGNRENIALLKNALNKGKKVFTLRNSEECSRYYGEMEKQPVPISCIADLLEQLAR